jgi:hypothetical protein
MQKAVRLSRQRGRREQWLTVFFVAELAKGQSSLVLSLAAHGAKVAESCQRTSLTGKNAEPSEN